MDGVGLWALLAHWVDEGRGAAAAAGTVQLLVAGLPRDGYARLAEALR